MRTPGKSLHPQLAALWWAIRRPVVTVGPWARRAYDRVFEEVQIWMEDLAAQMAFLSGRDLGSALAGADQAGTVQRV
jgi:hypothetical protein